MLLAVAFVLPSYVLEPDEFNILFVTFKVCVPPVNVQFAARPELSAKESVLRVTDLPEPTLADEIIPVPESVSV